jgi:uncharacterized membrane protein YeiH
MTNVVNGRPRATARTGGSSSPVLVLAVAPKGIDLSSAVVLGVITATGGGTLRDLVLGFLTEWEGLQTLAA